MANLRWADIFTSADELPFEQLFACWPGAISDPIRSIGASAFGDLFFERQSGQVERLDVLEGGVHHVAESFEAFSRLMNTLEWQEQNLLSEGVALLVERGLIRGPGQFYAFAPHPAFTGKIDWSRVMVMDALIWHSIWAQTLGSSA